MLGLARRLGLRPLPILALLATLTAILALGFVCSLELSRDSDFLVENETEKSEVDVYQLARQLGTTLGAVVREHHLVERDDCVVARAVLLARPAERDQQL